MGGKLACKSVHFHFIVDCVLGCMLALNEVCGSHILLSLFKQPYRFTNYKEQPYHFLFVYLFIYYFLF